MPYNYLDCLVYLDMKKFSSVFFTALVFLAIFSAGFIPANAQTSALSPFGGRIIYMQPCLYPFGGFYIRLGPPKGGSFIYQLGLSRSYLSGPPSHVGQWLLGMAASGIRCATDRDDGEWEDWRTGGLILFHGSSAI